jgi:hypothetical protein
MEKRAISYFDALGKIYFDSKEEEFHISSTIICNNKSL